jgi:23S rRNA (uracil1939-C5)-methyltransferase
MSRRHKSIPVGHFPAQIDSLSHDGRGIAHINGKTTFISGSLPNETVNFRYISQQKRFDEGITVEVVTPSPMRIAARCAHFGVCGGCSLQHVAAADQIALKQAMLLELLEHVGKVQAEEIAPPLQAEVWGYRRKARLGVKYVQKKQSLLVGFREQQSGFLAELSRCEVLHPSVGERIQIFRDVFETLQARESIAQIEVAVDDTHTALVIRNMVSLPTADLQILRDFAKQYEFHVFLQPKGIDSVTPLYPENQPVLGLRYELPEQGVSFQFAPSDFTQVNAPINRLMVAQALEWLEPQADETVLDLFCGLGNFTLPLAKRAANVVGVEGDAGLLARAEMNAHAQDIRNVYYYTANLADPKLQQAWMPGRYQKILLDPPRSGAAEIIQALPFKDTQRIVYVSCNPATLARDAGILVHEKGFRLKRVGVMDMFPHTAHVESMALFER